MDRVKTKTFGSDMSQWIFRTHKVYKWIQDFIESNIKKFISKLLINSGVFFYGDQNYLECTSVTINGDKYRIVIEPGSAINTNGDMIIVNQQIIDLTFDNPGYESYKYLYLKHILADDTDSDYEINRMPSSYSNVNVHQMDFYELILDDGWPTGDELNKCIKIAIIHQFFADMLRIEIADEREPATLFNIPLVNINWLNDNCSEITKDGTTAEEFTVDGARVLTEPTEPPPPLNIRIYDINPVYHMKNSAVAGIIIKWNWEALSGAHYLEDGANTIRVTGVKAGDYRELDVSQNQLAGFRLRCSNFPTPDDTYLIVSNLATTGDEGEKQTIITLEEDYNNESMTENGSISINGDDLLLEVIPYRDGKEVESEIIRYDLPRISLLTNEYKIPSLQMRDKDGSQARYNIRMYSRMKTFMSEYRVMGAGYYDPDHVGGGQAIVEYTAPFECKLPLLDDTGADLTLATTQAGFQIEIVGWKAAGDLEQTAHEFEAIRTTMDNVNWNDYDNSIRVITMDRFIDVPCSSIRKYAVGVRPLQNKQVVGTPVEKSIVSGSMGVAPSDTAILNAIEVDIRTFSGTLSFQLTPGNYHVVKLSSIKFPYGDADIGAESFLSYVRKWQSFLLDSSGKSFIIGMHASYIEGSDAVVMLYNISGEVQAPSNGAFAINTTERGRRIAVLNSLSIEYDSVKGYFDSDVIIGANVDNPAVLRVCQNTESGKAHADLLDVYENDAMYEFPTDFTIRNSYGSLSLLFDAFDPQIGSPNNIACIQGRFSLYVRPYIISGANELRPI
ncbi:MAG: hypothetical protein WCY30_00045 [Candidatus Neomarinimicrobiota bacterium]